MSYKGMRSYFRNTLSFTLVFALVCVGIISSVWSQGVYKKRTESYEGTGKIDEAYINTLLLGVDKDGFRTDVIILAQLNLIDKSISMLQIPRDTYIATNKIDYKMNSVCQSYKSGRVELDITKVYRAIEYLLGVEVNNYIMVDFEGFRNVIDSIGGVDFDVPRRMLYDDPEQNLHINLQKGFQHLNGNKAEQLVRFRQNNDGSGYVMGDLDRNKVQKDFIYAVIDKVFSIQNVTKIPEIISNVTKSVSSTFTNSDMLRYAPYVMSIDKENINIMGLEGVAEDRGGGSYFIANEILNKQITDKYFASENVSADSSELLRRDNLLSKELDNYIKTDESRKPSSALSKIFIKIDVVNGSNGKINTEAVVSLIESNGYKVANIIETGNVIYDKSRLISTNDDSHANDISSLLAFEEYVVGDVKKSDANITVVIGTDWYINN